VERKVELRGEAIHQSRFSLARDAAPSMKTGKGRGAGARFGQAAVAAGKCHR
jgi:hypothetical protein